MRRITRLAQLDRRYVWHPFTQMRDWMRRKPIVIRSGRGAVLHDVDGRSYLDANSSIWTNLHGHQQPQINAALRAQLRKIAHSSALGLANEPASLLAEKLVAAAAATIPRARPSQTLSRVFFSDDGSTAMEVAVKLAYESARRLRGLRRPKFLSLAGAYHGDTLGAASVGHIDLFQRAFGGLLFPSDQVMAPYCYRCPFNQARPERADARLYRRCRWECVDEVERRLARQRRRRAPYAAAILEPRVQGAAGMIPQPAGWLQRVTTLLREFQTPWVADEVLTGFGRTGTTSAAATSNSAAWGSRENLFACQQEGVEPDFLVVAKGLTGGYLPMAATLTTSSVFEAFLGKYEEFKSFFHGHSYTANQLGAAAALASLKLLQQNAAVQARARLEALLDQELASLWKLPHVGDVRQIGLIAGIELVRNWRTREPFALRERAGMRVCDAMARHGVLTRPIGNVVVLLPPYCTTSAQLGRMVGALRKAIAQVFP